MPIGDTTAEPLRVNACAISFMTQVHRDGTRLGIARARARGVTWGRHGKILAEQNRQQADEFAEELRPLILELNPTLPDGCRRSASHAR